MNDIHAPTVERCAQELETGLNVHRWIDLWQKDGQKIDEKIAIAFYHQAIQDGWESLRALVPGALNATSIRDLHAALQGTTVSACENDITIACDNPSIRETILKILMNEIVFDALG